MKTFVMTAKYCLQNISVFLSSSCHHPDASHPPLSDVTGIATYQVFLFVSILVLPQGLVLPHQLHMHSEHCP